MSTRAGHIGSFPFTQSRGGNLRRVLIFGLVVMGLMLYVGGKVQIMRLGYQIEELEKQKRDLERRNRSLQIEASSLSAPGRIEEIAVKRLGMVRPAKENVVVVKRKQYGAPRTEKRPAVP
jgi:cell division protein FtsL